LSVRLPPPSSPLFPYTTLFRSKDSFSSGFLAGISERSPLIGTKRPFENSKGWLPIFRRAARDPSRRLRLGVSAILSDAEIVFATDRKSTRLNSSHVSISYAVFC